MSREGDHLHEMQHSAGGESSQAVASTSTSQFCHHKRCYTILSSFARTTFRQAHIRARQVGGMFKVEVDISSSRGAAFSLRLLFSICLVPLEFSYLGLGIV